MRPRRVAAALLPAALLPAAPLAAQAPAPAPAPAPAGTLIALHADSSARALRPTPPAAPPAPAAAVWAPSVTFFGEVRTRSELDHPVGAARADAFTYLRTRLGARALVGEGVRVVVQAQDSRVLGTEGLPNAANTLDLYEGYLEIARPWRRTQLALRAGRQEIAVGNERLVGRVNWSNTGRSFDGVRLTAGPAAPAAAGGRAAWSATAFAATLAERGARFGGAPAGTPAEPDHYVFGLAGARPLGAVPGATAELTAVHDRGVHARGREVAGRTTVAGRLRAGRVLGVSADVEAAVQAGAQHVLATASAPASPRETVRAWMVGARVGTPAAAPNAARRVSATAGADLLSGDATPADGRDGAFSTLYATNHGFYGLEDVIAADPAASLGGRGLADAFATATVAATRALALRVDVHRMAAARTRGLPGSLLGWEADVVAPYRIVPGTAVELGYAAFRAGDAGAALGLGQAGRVRGWAYVQLTAGF